MDAPELGAAPAPLLSFPRPAPPFPRARDAPVSAEYARGAAARPVSYGISGRRPRRRRETRLLRNIHATDAAPPRDPSPTEYPGGGRGGAATHVDIRAAKVPSSGRAPVRSPRGRRPRVAGAAGRPREVAQAEGRDAYRLLLQEIYSAHPARVRPLLVGSGAIAMQLLVLLTIAQHLCGFRSLRGSHWAYGAASCFPPRRDDARLG